ncbi:hypothetical protein [Legionella sp. km772]|uniref:hypothetical protein n=1 Tax=Legionella sp. km772 TaxID=2498111 RepID=UPI0018F64908|nr:hypothetical protein [Legionella sp. km772]
MNHYIWFHPSYVQESDEELITGQKKNAQQHGYLVLAENELHKVKKSDHLTLVGHSTPPPSADKSNLNDSGDYIQGESAPQCVKRLKQAGLRCGPKIFSLESCLAGLPDGIAQQLSRDPFFKYTLIEANTTAVGRSYGAHWALKMDYLGRAILNPQKSMWHFYLQGYEIQRLVHASYKLEQVLEQIKPAYFQQRFFSNYQPGCFGGRVGRDCAKGILLTLERALFFAQENQNSATADALDLTLKQIYTY